LRRGAVGWGLAALIVGSLVDATDPRVGFAAFGGLMLIFMAVVVFYVTQNTV